MEHAWSDISSQAEGPGLLGLLGLLHNVETKRENTDTVDAFERFISMKVTKCVGVDVLFPLCRDVCGINIIPT